MKLNGNTAKLVKIILFSFLLLPTIILPQDSNILFQNGLMKEEGEGNLKEAIEIYQSIVQNGKYDNFIRANALLHIGMCHEKLGKIEASKSYQQIVENFSDQSEIVQIAKERLLALGNPSSADNELAQNTPKYIQVNFEHDLKYLMWQTYDISPDGKYVAFTSQGKSQDFVPNKYGELYVSDISGSVVKKMTEYLPKHLIQVRAVSFSPTDNLIAFSAAESDSIYLISVFIVKTDGSECRKLKENINAYDFLWSADGKTITMGDWREKKFITIDLNGNTVNEIPYEKDMRIGLNSLSPDGKWICSYRRIPDPEKIITDLWLTSIDGEKDVRLTNRIGRDAFGAFSKDGKSIYFVSERNGNENIFKIQIDLRTGKAIDEPVQITNYKDASIALPKINRNTGQLSYLLSNESQRIDAIKIGKEDTIVAIARGDSPQISPEGDQVYYKSVEHENPGILRISFDGGTPEKIYEVTPEDKISLSPDGKFLSFSEIKDSANNLILLNLSDLNSSIIATFNTNELNKVRSGMIKNFVPIWSPDSKTLAFIYDSTLYSYSLKEKKLSTLTSNINWEFNSLVWDPNGKFIAGTGFENSKYPFIFLYSLQSKSIKKLTDKDEKYYKSNLSWHPDGKRLTYSVNLFLPRFYIDGFKQVLIDDNKSQDFLDQSGIKEQEGTWAPNGRYFYFRTAFHHGAFQINKFDEQTKEITILDDEFISYFNGLPTSWSANGTRMVRPVTTETTKIWIIEGYD